MNPLRPSELVAWQQTTGILVHPHEADALYRLDAAFRNPQNYYEPEKKK